MVQPEVHKAQHGGVKLQECQHDAVVYVCWQHLQALAALDDADDNLPQQVPASLILWQNVHHHAKLQRRR